MTPRATRARRWWWGAGWRRVSARCSPGTRATRSSGPTRSTSLAWAPRATSASLPSDALRKERPLEWHDGAWRSERRYGHHLVWFPEPVGARECESVAGGVRLLCEAVPGVREATVVVGEPPIRRAAVAYLMRKPVDDGWGAARVEVWGWRGQAREAIVYGVVERPAVAAGTVLAVTAARLAGLVEHLELQVEPIGALGLGGLVRPAPFLAELARRGVKAAAFEGVTVS